MTDAPAPGRVERAAAVLVMAMHIVALAIEAYLLRDTYHGDPNIYLVFARNMAQGDFFSFNPGEFSSGSTGPLWPVLLAPLVALGATPPALKVFVLGLTITASLLLFRACTRVSGSPLASALCAAATMSSTAMPGLLFYESALTQCLVALAVLVTLRFVEIRNGDTSTPAPWWGLGLIWAALPLSRPDTLLIVLLNGAALMWLYRRDARIRNRFVLVFACAMVPAIAYFGASYFITGYLSVSGTARAFAAREQAAKLSGLRQSTMAARLLWQPTLILLSISAIWAYHVRGGQTHGPVMRRWVVSTLLGMVIAVTIVFPAFHHMLRYLIPVMPLLAVMASIGVRDIRDLCLRHRWRFALALAMFVLAVGPIAGVLRTAHREAAKGANFDTVMEKAIAERFNQLAPEGSRLLTYEVQLRYYLRPDIVVLSLDGVTDARVTPYLSSGDMLAYLRRYRPEYWLSNEAVRYRTYLVDGPLARAMAELGDEVGASVEIDGIRFTSVAVNQHATPNPVGFAGHRQLIRLEYLDGATG